MISLPNRKAWPGLLALVALVVFGIGCKDFFTDPKLTSIAITSDQPSVVIANSVQLQAVGTYDDGNKKDITGSAKWSATPAGLVTIDASGKATGVASGNASITAKSGIITSNSLTLVVGSLTSITVTPADTTVSLASTTSQQFIATGHFSSGTTLDITGSVTWTPSTQDATFDGATPGLATLHSVPVTNPITITATSSAATNSVVGTTTLRINP